MMPPLDNIGPIYSQLEDDKLSYILAENVKRLRKKAHISKSRFSLMINVGRPFLNRIEKGEADPRLSVIARIADALEVTPEELLTPYEEQTRLAQWQAE